MINTESSWPYLGLATREPDARTRDLEAPFLSLSLSLSVSLLYAILICAASFILFHIVHIILLC
jgi:hypothetical protein